MAVKDFRLYKEIKTRDLITLEKESATVIEPGDMVTLDDDGYAIKAVAASTAVAYTDAGAIAGETEIQVLGNQDVWFLATADANYAISDRGIECDLVGTTTQLVDLGASTTDVFKVYPGKDDNVVAGETTVLVKINKTIS